MWRKLKLNIRVLFYLGLLIVGILLRLYRISTESISLEEYACIANLNAENVLDFISLQRHTYPFGGILFPLLQFLWGGLIGTEITSLRLLSILFWVATYVLVICFVYLEEEKGTTLPRGVSVFVAIGLCLSPALVFLGQEARMYMAYVFFAWCSIISLYYLLLEPGSFMGGLFWCLSNALLLWTHHIGIVLWGVEALIVGFIFIKEQSVRKNLMLLGVFHFIIALPWVMWVLTIPPQPAELYQYYLPPGIKDLIVFPFAFNIVRYGGICPADAYLSFYYLPQQMGEVMRASHRYLNWLLLIVSLTSLLGFISSARQNNSDKRRFSLYLLTIFVLSPILLFLIAKVGPPVFNSRYLVFLLPFHFIGLGMLISSARKIFRVGFILAVCFLLLYQIGYMVSASWRMDWKGVGKAITTSATGEDMVIIRDPFWTKIFKVNCQNLGIPVSDAYTYDGIIDIAKVYLTSLDNSSSSGSVWVVVPDVHGEGVPTFMSRIDGRSFSVSVRMFPGEQRIWLYKINLGKLPSFEYYTALLTGYGKYLPDVLEEAGERLEEFYERHRYDHDRTQFHLVRAGLVLARERKFSVAGNLIIKAWSINPHRILKDWELFGDLIPMTATKGDANFVILYEGLKCFLERDFALAIDYFYELSIECSEDPLPFWFIAKAYDFLGDTSKADFFWRNVFIRRPILPLGWHLSYEPAVITLDRNALSMAKQREERLGIIIDELGNE